MVTWNSETFAARSEPGKPVGSATVYAVQNAAWNMYQAWKEAHPRLDPIMSISAGPLRTGGLECWSYTIVIHFPSSTATTFD